MFIMLIFCTFYFSSNALAINISGICVGGEDDGYFPELPKNVIMDRDNSYYPSSYDPRTQNKTTPIKNQGNQGTCVLFASNAALEQKSIYQTGVKNIYSEESAKYITSNSLPTFNNLNSFVGYYENSYSSSRNFTAGFQYLTNRNQPILDSNSLNWISPNFFSDIPYNTSYNNSWYSNILSSKTNAYASELYYIHKNEIKQSIIENGAVYARMKTSGFYNSFAVYNSTIDFDNPVNHAIIIVGWDDNYSKDNFSPNSKPSNNGAWLVKNSWGTNTNGGYLWISYEDKPLSFYGRPMTISKIDKESDYEYMLSYDFLPIIQKNYTHILNHEYYIANVYDITDLQDNYNAINRVTFYASNVRTPNDTYDIFISPIINNSLPSVNDLGNSLSHGEISHEGYITGYFPSNYTLNHNYNKYAIIIKFSSSYDYLYISKEGKKNDSFTPVANKGESFFCESAYSGWNDICENQLSVTDYGNYCIRPVLIDTTSNRINSNISKTFIANSGQAISINLILNGNRLYSIRNGTEVLYQDSEYIRNGDTITFTQDYIDNLPNDQNTIITFEFTDGASKTLTIHSKYNITSLSVSGKYAIGQTLTANAYRIGIPVNLNSVEYQWQYSVSKNGTYSDIPGATSKTFSITSQFFNKYIRVKVSSLPHTNLVYPQTVISSSDETQKIILYGDANSDGLLSVSDVSYINKSIMGTVTLNSDQSRAADVNGDDNVDEDDALLIQKRLSNIIDHFPVEE